MLLSHYSRIWPLRVQSDSGLRHRSRPWRDGNSLRSLRPYWVTREKIDRVKAQLTELLTNYSEITALVIDGWNAAWSRLNYEEMPFLDDATVFLG